MAVKAEAKAEVAHTDNTMTVATMTTTPIATAAAPIVPHYGYWDDARSWDYRERERRCVPSTSNPRDRFITQMMEDERYHWRKQHDPDFIGSATSGGSSTKSKDREGGNVDDGADEFDAKLEKRRKQG